MDQKVSFIFLFEFEKCCNALIYKYTTVKNPEDDMLVHVGNLNANGDGYIFKETDDWSGVAGSATVKLLY